MSRSAPQDSTVTFKDEGNERGPRGLLVKPFGIGFGSAAVVVKVPEAGKGPKGIVSNVCPLFSMGSDQNGVLGDV